METTMNTATNESQVGNEQVIRMLEGALEKVKQGAGRSAVLLTIKPNGVDITSQFTDLDDLPAAIAKCDSLKASMVDMLHDIEQARKQIESNKQTSSEPAN